MSSLPRGTVVTHRLYGWRGVILASDSECAASEAWRVAHGVLKLPHGVQQPFYHVVVDARDQLGRQFANVAHDNEAVEDAPTFIVQPVLVPSKGHSTYI